MWISTDFGGHKDVTYLEVRASYRFCQLIEKRFLDFHKLGWVHNLKDVFDFVEKHDFFGAVYFGPVAQETHDYL